MMVSETRLSEHEFRSSEQVARAGKTFMDYLQLQLPFHVPLHLSLTEEKHHVPNPRHCKDSLLEQRGSPYRMLTTIQPAQHLRSLTTPTHHQVLNAFHKIIQFSQPHEPDVLRYIVTLPADDTTGTFLYMIEEYAPPAPKPPSCFHPVSLTSLDTPPKPPATPTSPRSR